VALGLLLGSAGLSRAQAKAPAAPLAKPVSAATGAGKATGKSAPRKPPKLDVAALEARLAQPETLAAGLADVAAAGAAAKKLAPRIEELLKKGLPVELAIAAVRALGATSAPSSSAVVAPYVQHRNAELRAAAAHALASTRGPDASVALRRGLRSNDAAVRALSASGLRFAGDQESVPDLLRALDRNVTEAAVSIGALCSAAQCDDLIARLDKLAPDVQKATFETMLQRKPALPDDVLIRAMDKARIAAGPSAKAYLQGLEATFKGSKPVKKALEAAARAAKEPAP